ncbi:MAG TPA: alpha/beta fold hydrolase [Anditalea sp.]|nr:alpha/beta fold hydrolase [Anditalea sp.]
MKYSNYIFIIIISLLLSACRLDDNLFNNDNSITSYLFDDYVGEVDFILDDSYSIPNNMIHPFTLQSKTASERTSTTIHAVYIGDINTIASDTVIMYCHGNRDHLDFYWNRAKLLANAGGKNRFGVLMIDYRGYGLSGGKPTEPGMYADINAGLQWLRESGLSSDRLVMYGFSLGSAAATEMAANHNRYAIKPSKLILEAPFASTAVMVQDASLLSMHSSFFTSVQVNNADKIRNVDVPFLWIHGTNDSFLNILTHGEVVFKNYGGPKAIPFRIPGGEHGDLPKVMGFESYNQALVQFITGS